MADGNMQIKSLRWNELTSAKWDVIYKECGISLLEGDSTFHALTGTYEIRMVIILICLQGSLKLSDSNSLFELKAGDAMISMPGTIIHHEMASPDLRYKVLCLSPDVVAKHSAKKGYFTKFSRRNVPYAIIHFDSQMLLLIDAYCSILKIKIGQDDIADQNIIISNIICCLLFDILNKIPQATSVEAIKQTQGYKYVIFQNFIQLVTKDNGTLRSVKEYARRLNISPKYLSVICRDSSGKSASEWIDQILDSEIKRLLRYTDLSMKEISVCLKFSSSSCFSKYVRQHFNMSGVEYRKYLRKTSDNI